MVKYVSGKDRKAITAGLKEIYLASSADAASDSLEKFAEKRDGLQAAYTTNGIVDKVVFLKNCSSNVL